MQTRNNTAKVSLFSQEHGYRDYNVHGLGLIHRACVPFNIKKGDLFNVYVGKSTKVACEWIGDLETSLIGMIES